MLTVADEGRVRTLTLDRPEALNAFNEDLYRATAAALVCAAEADNIAVLLITGSGRGFSAGTDVVEMAELAAHPERRRPGTPGFVTMVDALSEFPKPIVCAVNGLALGIGATLLGYADLVLMSEEARVRCPFTDLAVAPEAGSSYLFPLLLGRQEATWMLMSSEWFSAEECARMGLAWRVTAADRLMPEARAVAHQLAAKPLASLIECKRTIVAGHRALITAARQREDTAFSRLLGQPASLEALTALAERRSPDFAAVDREHPVDVERHRRD